MASGSSNQGIADSLVITSARRREIRLEHLQQAGAAVDRHRVAPCLPSCCTSVVDRTPENRPRLASLPSSRAAPLVRAWGNVKTRIIQNEPEPEPSVETEAAAPSDEREAWLRRACFLGAVVGYFIIGVIHPADLEVGDETSLYLWIHLVQPVLILLLAWGIWLLSRTSRDGPRESRASRSCRTRSSTRRSTRSRESRSASSSARRTA